MQSFVSMIVMMIMWYRRRITLYQGGKVIAIGTMRFISDQWVTIRDVTMADGRKIGTLAVGRNRIDLFWRYRPGDEKDLESVSRQRPTPTPETALQRGLAKEEEPDAE